MTEGATIRNLQGFLELIQMRPDEQIDPQKVGAYLEGKLPGVSGTPAVLQFEGGKANLTYLLRYGEREFVLRRPPLGPVAPHSHDMARESRVLSTLPDVYRLAPRAYHFSQNLEIVGAPFFVMERRKGIVIREEMPQRFAGQTELHGRMSEMIVDALATLHKVDANAIGLGDLGRPEGFIERQIYGWLKRWDGAKTEDVPRFVQLHDWLLKRIPKPQTVSLLHNDFKLDNMMVSEDDPGVPVAVFDWDMCTLGDPLADLGTLVAYWTEPGDSDSRKSFGPMPTQLPGWYSRANVVERYAQVSGLDLSDADFYHAFALYKTTVIIQQIYVRFHRGQTQDTRFASYGKKALGLLDAAWEVAAQSKR